MKCYNLPTREGRLLHLPPFSINPRHTPRATDYPIAFSPTGKGVVKFGGVCFFKLETTTLTSLSRLNTISDVGAGQLSPASAVLVTSQHRVSPPSTRETILMYTYNYTQPHLETSENQSPITNFRLGVATKNGDLTRRRKTYRGLDTSQNSKNIQREIAFSGVSTDKVDKPAVTVSGKRNQTLDNKISL